MGYIIELLLSLSACSGNVHPQLGQDDSGLPTTKDAAQGEETFVAPEDASTPHEDWTADLLHTELDIDLKNLRGTATTTVLADNTVFLSLETAGLNVLSVSDVNGNLSYAETEGRTDVILRASGRQTVTVKYAFAEQSTFTGLLADGSTQTWPCCCYNVFPCRSAPSEGQTFGLRVHDAPANQQAIYPERIEHPAAAYQLAWAVGNYQYVDLGRTHNGTTVGYWKLPNTPATAATGTKDLVAAFDWLEQTLGPYPFGSKVGSVAVDWGREATLSGMEDHPYWHISNAAMADPETHIHEAIHGWFGDGVRIACWEDLVLSEGTTSYLTARVLGEIVGPDAEARLWGVYDEELKRATATQNVVAWPSGCGTLKANDPAVFRLTAYYKGAYFFREIADQVGTTKLDQVLGSFIGQNLGQAARMQALIEHINKETGFDPSDLVDKWLK